MVHHISLKKVIICVVFIGGVRCPISGSRHSLMQVSTMIIFSDAIYQVYFLLAN